MRHRRRLARLLIIATIMISMLTPQLVLAKSSSMDNPTATDVNYSKDGDKRTGIKTFTIDPYTYYNVKLDKKDFTILNDSELLQIAQTEIFKRWGIIAEGIFRDQASQLVTIEGSGMMSSDQNAKQSFDKHFSYDRPGTSLEYSDYDWSLGDLALDLATAKGHQTGETEEDEVRVTGIVAIENLAAARRLMGQELRNCNDDDDVTIEDFLGNEYDKSDGRYRLPDLDDKNSGSGFANIVTCVNQCGSSGDYDYVTFGLAVYDFDLSPIAANGLSYASAADGVEDVQAILDGEKGNYETEDGGISYHSEDVNDVPTYTDNKSAKEVETATTLQNTTTISNTLTTQETRQWGMTQTIGTNVNCWPYGGGPLIPLPHFTIQFSKQFSELWNTMKSKSESQSETKTKSITTNLTLPGHTVAKVVQNTNNATVKEKYQQPMVLSYKVAIFAMSGDYYNGGWGGGINSSRYDKQWMSVIFDGSDQIETCGCCAFGSLYNRAVVNRDTPDYDGQKGRYNSWCDKGAWRRSYTIDWKKINEIIKPQAYYRESHRIISKKTGENCTLDELATEIPFLESACTLSNKKTAMTSSVEEILPMYKLASVGLKQGNKKYNVSYDDTFYLDNLTLEGYDADGVEFYRFKPSWGEWKLKDSQGTIIEDGSELDEDPEEGIVKSGYFNLIYDENLDLHYVKTDNIDTGEGSVYLTWVLNNDEKMIPYCNNQMYYREYMSSAEIAKVKTPTIQLHLKKSFMANSDERSVEVSGEKEYTGYLSKNPDSPEEYQPKEINLHDVFNVSARIVSDPEQQEDVPIYWEEVSGDGITISKNGECILKKPGEYKIRAYCRSSQTGDDAELIYSDELTIKVAEEPVLTSISLDTSRLGEPLIDNNTPSIELNLENCMVYKDQNGNEMDPGIFDETGKWRSLVPKITFGIDNEETAHLNDWGLLTVTKPGTYTISANVYDEKDDELPFVIEPAYLTVAGNDWISSIEFDDTAVSGYDNLILNKPGDVAKVEKLESLLLYSGQDGNPWTGDKPEVNFTVDADPDSAEIKDGSLIIYKPGQYRVRMESEDTFIDFATFYAYEELSSDPDDLTRLIIEPVKLPQITLDGSTKTAEVDLERVVEYKTLFGQKWDGNTPELIFTLDDSVKNARLTKLSEVTNETTGEKREYDAFVTSTPGNYLVHVTAKDSSQYTKPIDDIEITVLKKNTEQKAGENTEKKTQAKNNQKIKVKKKTKTIKLKKLKKKNQTVKPLKVSGAKGKVTYKKISVTKKKKGKKQTKNNKKKKGKKTTPRFTVNKKTGKIIVNKKTKKGTYKIKIKISAAGDATYNAAEKTVTVVIKIK